MKLGLNELIIYLPLNCNLNLYDPSFSNGLEMKQLKQIRELKWLEKNLFSSDYISKFKNTKTNLAEIQRYRKLHCANC